MIGRAGRQVSTFRHSNPPVFHFCMTLKQTTPDDSLTATRDLHEGGSPINSHIATGARG